ncbi:hypothetical protein Hypma_016207 [Hypsizygus marmoreus]|uniref:Uncharacterized protein n=1 Tax=Hypsizygus marmoreus TaxID=39966 RepID=A0A369J0E2_HYPMA|nr:hypothetical protein Hypma_016207 [Hypsizygus marmoreus]
MAPKPFQLHYLTNSPEEHSSERRITPKRPPPPKTEDEILKEIVPTEYHDFADVFSAGDAKELPATPII